MFIWGESIRLVFRWMGTRFCFSDLVFKLRIIITYMRSEESLTSIEQKCRRFESLIASKQLSFSKRNDKWEIYVQNRSFALSNIERKYNSYISFLSLIIFLQNSLWLWSSIVRLSWNLRRFENIGGNREQQRKINKYFNVGRSTERSEHTHYPVASFRA